MIDNLTPILLNIVSTAEEGLSTLPAYSVLVPGVQSAWDDCCAGQLALRVREIVEKPVVRGAACPAGWSITCGLELVRCVATVNDQGEAPNSGQITADGSAAMLDMQELHQALRCTIPKIAGISNLTIERWRPVGPQGGCAGGEWTFNFLWTGWCGCEEKVDPDDGD